MSNTMSNRVYLKAQEWLLRGNKEANPIDAFSNYWRGFNNLFFDIGPGRERDKIRAFIEQCTSEAKAEELLRNNSSGVAYLLSEPVIDMRGSGKDTTAYIQAFHIETNFLVKLQEVFMVIYQVRCNLEHGQKSPSADRDIRLLKCASPLVAALIENGLIGH